MGRLLAKFELVGLCVRNIYSLNRNNGKKSLLCILKIEVQAIKTISEPFRCACQYPKFKGSLSIKNVLPVMDPELSYDEMEIGKGDQAMLAWWELINDMLSIEEAEKTKTALLEYCKLDTWAMVKIYQKLYLMI